MSDSSPSMPSSPSSFRNFHSITLADLLAPEKLIFIDESKPVAQAFEIMEKDHLNCLPVQPEKGRIVESFDWSDLNAYLLLVLGRINYPDPQFRSEVENARRGVPSSVKFACKLGVKDPFIRMPISSPLDEAIQKFGNGVHRIAGVDVENNVVGILSQRRMLRYLSTNIKRFPFLEASLDKTLAELSIGTYTGMVTVQADAPVIYAFNIMHDGAVSSVAIVDKEQNLVGNLSIADVALVTNSRQSPLLQQSCRHFLTVILENRGLIDGKDPVPVFFVERTSTLRKVIAKMVATRAHRLWIVEQAPDPTTSGKLIGVVSLTDILHYVAGLNGHLTDPETTRRHRRSSSCSVSRKSIDIARKDSS